MSWYTGDPLYDTVLLAALCFPPLIWVAAKFLDAPYGRFGDKFVFAKLNARHGWFLMELPAILVFWPAFLSGPRASTTVPVVFACVWALHYTNRGIIFPWRLRVPANSRTFSLVVVVMGMLTTAVHGFLSGYYLSRHGDHLVATWIHDPRFSVGMMLYLLGMTLNIHSDSILRGLRTRTEVERNDRVYRIPRGGGFAFVSSPQYLGELLAWTGFSLATWSLAGVFILATSMANLIPRAVSTHRWYHARFANYPRDRKILVPFIF